MSYHRNYAIVKIFMFFLFIIACSLLLPGCKKQTNRNTPFTKSTFLLNTIISISLYDSTDESIIDEAFALCQEYELLFSKTIEESELYKLNHRSLPLINGSYQVSSELSSLIASGLYYGKLSNGSFDITIEPLSSLWDFQAESPSIPSHSAIQSKLKEIDYSKVHVTTDGIRFDDATTTIDLGGIAKGYIADRLKDFLLSKGVTSAMINLGGNILCVGEKPGGNPFTIGIQKPFADRNETISVMSLKDVSVVSSGVYERFFELDGRLYHHILNPKTGYPYDNGLISVTIISDASMDGDALSTTTFALGLDEGLQLIDSLENVYAVFITSDYQLHYSNGFFENITIKNNEWNN